MMCRAEAVRLFQASLARVRAAYRAYATSCGAGGYPVAALLTEYERVCERERLVREPLLPIVLGEDETDVMLGKE